MLMQYRDGLKLALESLLSEHPESFVFGLDVDDHKGIFGSTIGLKEKFGAERVFGTPLSEDAMTGFAIGAALHGKRPVHIHIRADFALLAMNQLINMAATIEEITNGNLSVPLTVRMVIGRGWGQGAQHSKSLHSMLSHIPGLEVFLPTTPQDAYSLSLQAFKSNRPSVVIEHRWLYDVSGNIDTNKKIVPCTEIMRPGKDFSIISNSWMTVEALLAAEILKDQLDVEVIDIKSPQNIDWELIHQSVRKTKNVLVLDHDWTPMGLSEHLGFHIYQKNSPYLQSPIEALGHKFTHCPTARPLEDQFYIKANQIVEHICRTKGLKSIEIPTDKLWTYENKFKGPF